MNKATRQVCEQYKKENSPSAAYKLARELKEHRDNAPWTLPEPENTTKCDCGSEKVYGKTDNPALHSNWCSLLKGENENIPF